MMIPLAVLLVALLAAPTPARPLPTCKPGQAQFQPAPGRAWIPERGPVKVKVCQRLKPIVIR